MGQSVASVTCQSVEGCCRQHVFPDRVSDTVKVDISLLQLPAAGGASGYEENTQPPPAALTHSPDTDCLMGEKECPPPVQATSVPKAAPVLRPPTVSYKSWEAGWLGAAPSHAVSADFAEVSRSTSAVDSTPEAPSFAQQMAHFRLPDETTKVLTGLLVSVSHSDAEVDAIKNKEAWSWDAHALTSPRSSTPTTNAGRSTPSDSPAMHGLCSPMLSPRCRSSEGTDSQNSSPVCKRPQEAAIQEAQSLFASMLSSSRQGGKGAGVAGCSKRRHSAPPMPAEVAGADMAAGGGRCVEDEKRPARRCLSVEPESAMQEVPVVKAPRLRSLNGRLPRFPPAELQSIEQLKAKRRSRLP